VKFILVIAIFLLVIALVTYGIIRLIESAGGAAARKRRLKRAKWHPVTKSVGAGGWEVMLECEGQEPQLVRRLRGEQWAELADVQADAEVRAYELNVGLERERGLNA
jgi:hypothetical protein